MHYYYTVEIFIDGQLRKMLTMLAFEADEQSNERNNMKRVKTLLSIEVCVCVCKSCFNKADISRVVRCGHCGRRVARCGHCCGHRRRRRHDDPWRTMMPSHDDERFQVTLWMIGGSKTCWY
jgi:hypothetical protein